jgi:hypothetical protein
MNNTHPTHPTNMTKAELRKWAAALCEEWNWNAGLMDIANDLQEQSIKSDSREFAELTEVFNDFFGDRGGPPQIDQIEAIKNILEHNE